MTLYTVLKETEDYRLSTLTNPEDVKKHLKKYLVDSIKWKFKHCTDTLDEAEEWLTKVNSHEVIFPETIYNSKVIEAYKSYFPDWLLDKVGLHYGYLEELTQDKIEVKTHVSFARDHKNCIEIYSVWFNNTPVIVAVEGRSDKNGNDVEILITNKYSYKLMVSYLYQLKAEQVLAEEETTTSKDISIMWGYFTEDLLKEAT
jgi:hypothetical protein